MSHRTAATALLLASLPYGLALPQATPSVSKLTPSVTPLTLPLAPAVDGSKVTAIGTVVDPAVESAAESLVEEITDIIDEATETTASAPLKTTANVKSYAIPTGDLPTLDAEANILPLILPGVLPVETNLPPIDTPDVIPSNLPLLDPGIGNGSFLGDELPDTNELEVIDLPEPSEVPSSDDLPDTNDPEVIDLPVPIEMPYGDEGLIADPFEPIPYIPDFPEFPDFPEQTVPISTFNAVVQPLLSVIQTLLNSLPGNFAPPLPGIFIHPLLPTKTPEVLIDPILPTKVSETLSTQTPNILVDPLLPTETLDDAIFNPLVDPISLLADVIATDLPFVTKRQNPEELTTDSILDLIGPILEAINTFLAQIPVVGSTAESSLSDVADATPELSSLPLNVPAVPIAVPELPLPSLPAVVPELPVDTSDLTSGIPTISALPTISSELPTLLDWPFDNFEIPDTVSPDVAGELPDLSDLPTSDDVLNLPLPGLGDLGVPLDLLSTDVSTPPLPIDLASSLVLPTAVSTGINAFLSTSAVISIPTDLSDVPVPEGFEDVGVPVDALPDDALPVDAVPSLEGLPIPDDVLNVPVPELDEFGVPLDLPTDLAGSMLLPGILASLPPLPTNLFDVPVPEGFEDLGLPLKLPALVPPTDVIPNLENLPIPDGVLNLPIPKMDSLGAPIDLPTDVAVPALPTEAFGAGFPIQVGPDVPLVLPAETLPVLPTNEPPALSTESLPILQTDAIPAVPILQGVASSVPSVPAVQNIAPALPLTIPSLPFQVPGLALPLVKRAMLAPQAAPNVAPSVARPVKPDIVLGLIRPLLSLVSSRLNKLLIGRVQVPDVWKIPTVPKVPDVAGALPLIPGMPDMSSILTSLPAVPGVASILPTLPTVPDVAGIVVPALSLPPLPAITDSDTTPALSAVPDVAAILPTASAAPDVLPDPGVGEVISTVNDAVSVLPGVGRVTSTVTNAAPKIPLAFGSGLTKRRISNEVALKSFLDNLDESKQENLLEVVGNSVNTFNHVDTEDLAVTLQADFEDLSDAIKARILNAGGSERSIRNGKRQFRIPGAQSIGPNLDDAPKVDISAILGNTGTLDPMKQLNQEVVGHFEDDLPEGYLRPSQVVSSYDRLDDDSVDNSLNPEFHAILGDAGTLDPMNMLNPEVGPGSIVDDVAIQDPYADIRGSRDEALQLGPKEALPGLEATIQAAKNNHVSQKKKPRISFVPKAGGLTVVPRARLREQARVLK